MLTFMPSMAFAAGEEGPDWSPANISTSDDMFISFGEEYAKLAVGIIGSEPDGLEYYWTRDGEYVAGGSNLIMVEEAGTYVCEVSETTGEKTKQLAPEFVVEKDTWCLSSEEVYVTLTDEPVTLDPEPVTASGEETLPDLEFAWTMDDSEDVISTADTLTTDEPGIYTCTVTGQAEAGTNTETAEAVATFELERPEHIFTEPVYTWDSYRRLLTTYYTCNAYRICEDCGLEEEETVTIRAGVLTRRIKAPTCTERSKYVYTARFENPGFEDQILEIDRTGIGSAPLGHRWETEWDWSGMDDGHVYMTRICSRCGETETTEADVEAEVIPATWTEPKNIIYLATAVFGSGDEAEEYFDGLETSEGFNVRDGLEECLNETLDAILDCYAASAALDEAKDEYEANPNAETAAKYVEASDRFLESAVYAKALTEEMLDAVAAGKDAAYAAEDEIRDEALSLYKKMTGYAAELAEMAPTAETVALAEEDAAAAAEKYQFEEISVKALAALRKAAEAGITSANGYTDSSVKALLSAGEALMKALDSGDKDAVAAAVEQLEKAVDSAALKTANTLNVTAKKALKAKRSSSKSFKISKAVKISGAVGKKTYAKVGKAGGKKIKVNSKTGKITVKKGLKKGKTYKLKVKVTAAGNGDVKAASRTVTVKIKIK